MIRIIPSGQANLNQYIIISTCRPILRSSITGRPRFVSCEGRRRVPACRGRRYLSTDLASRSEYRRVFGFANISDNIIPSCHMQHRRGKFHENAVEK